MPGTGTYRLSADEKPAAQPQRGRAIGDPEPEAMPRFRIARGGLHLLRPPIGADQDYRIDMRFVQPADGEIGRAKPAQGGQQRRRAFRRGTPAGATQRLRQGGEQQPGPMQFGHILGGKGRRRIECRRAPGDSEQGDIECRAMPGARGGAI